MTDTSPYTLRLADGVPMAFPADHTLEQIRAIAQAYANGEHGARRGNVTIHHADNLVTTIEPTPAPEPDELQGRALFTEPTLTEAWYLEPRERVLWSRDNGDGTGVLRVIQMASGAESVFDVYYDHEDLMEAGCDEEDVKPCPRCSQPNPAGLVTSPTGEPAPCEECLAQHQPIWTVDEIATDDDFQQVSRRIAFGYEEFILKQTQDSFRSLEHGESVTLTFTRYHDNAR